MKSVHDAIEAADRLTGHGISAEVIDLRTLRPLDIETVLTSVHKTNRIVVLEEGPLTGGWAGEVLSLVTEQALGDLDDAWRIATPDLPVPYSPPLETRFCRASSGSSRRYSPGPRSAPLGGGRIRASEKQALQGRTERSYAVHTGATEDATGHPPAQQPAQRRRMQWQS